jgi:hypothetical protein
VGGKETKVNECMLCSPYNGVSGRLVRSSDHRFACARSNGWMPMHSYHGGYPTISLAYNIIAYSKSGSNEISDCKEGESSNSLSLIFFENQLYVWILIIC